MNGLGVIGMRRPADLAPGFLVAAVALILGATAPEAWAKKFAEARIFIEYNFTDNDLGFHVFLDAEDWREVEIVNPNGETVFEVEGGVGFGERGMTELFFEGAARSPFDVPLDELLALFPAGKY